MPKPRTSYLPLARLWGYGAPLLRTIKAAGRLFVLMRGSRILIFCRWPLISGLVCGPESVTFLIAGSCARRSDTPRAIQPVALRAPVGSPAGFRTDVRN